VRIIMIETSPVQKHFSSPWLMLCRLCLAPRLVSLDIAEGKQISQSPPSLSCASQHRYDLETSHQLKKNLLISPSSCAHIPLPLVLPFSGPAGKNGINGKDGRPGPSGPAGPRGKAGAPGAAGKNGKDGAPGQNGSPGPRGIEGVAGPAGPQVRHPSLSATSVEFHFGFSRFPVTRLSCPSPPFQSTLCLFSFRFPRTHFSKNSHFCVCDPSLTQILSSARS